MFEDIVRKLKLKQYIVIRKLTQLLYCTYYVVHTTMRLKSAVACLLVLLTTNSWLRAVAGQDVEVLDLDDADSSQVDDDVLQEVSLRD